MTAARARCWIHEDCLVDLELSIACGPNPLDMQVLDGGWAKNGRNYGGGYGWIDSGYGWIDSGDGSGDGRGGGDQESEYDFGNGNGLGGGSPPGCQ